MRVSSVRATIPVGTTGRQAVLLAWAIFGLTGTIGAAALIVSALVPGPNEAGGVGVGLGFLAYAFVGVVVSTRRPGDRIGALLLGLGLSGQIGMLSERAVTGGVSGGSPVLILAARDPLAMWIIPLLLQTWVISFMLLGVLLLTFPTGRPLTPRWRPVLWLSFAMIPVGMVTAGTSRSDALAVSLSTFPLLDVLFGTERGAALREAGQGIFGISQIGLFVVSAASLVVRYRRARGVERQQLKWLAYAALLLAVVFVGTAVIFFSPLRAHDPGAPIPPAVFGGIPFILALAAIPVAVGVAILRYRLYDIDVLINRTLVYGAVTALLASTYFGAVVLIQTALRPFTAGSELAVAGSTLLVVALFQPLRRRVQDTVDRRFYRSRYDAARTLDAFSARLRDQVDLDSFSRELIDVARDTVQPAHAWLWLRGARR